jgi:hypothetical protein
MFIIEYVDELGFSAGGNEQALWRAVEIDDDGDVIGRKEQFCVVSMDVLEDREHGRTVIGFWDADAARLMLKYPTLAIDGQDGPPTEQAIRAGILSLLVWKASTDENAFQAFLDGLSRGSEDD